MNTPERIIDLDNNATTPVLEGVSRAVVKAMAVDVGNPSSNHRVGRAAKNVVEKARKDVAKFLAVEADRIIFTSGATESNDAVLRQYGKYLLLLVEGSHPSLYAGHCGNIINLPVDRTGRTILSRLNEIFASYGRKAVAAVPVANGETGVIQPMSDICKCARQHGVRTLVDITQAIGRVLPEILYFDADWMTCSAHKMNGPKGVGCLVVGRNAPQPRMAAGGGQEQGRRSGTENVPGIAGFGAAARLRQLTLARDLARMEALREKLETGIVLALPFARVNGESAPRVATTTSITFSGLDGMAMVARLDAAGIMCSQVSACSSARPEPSAALLATGLSESDAFSTLRFSVSVFTSEFEIDKAIEIIVREARQLHEIMGDAA